MTTVKVYGFTVIELMLFLGITGVLFTVLMVGVNSNITQQRYRESVLNVSTLLQSQYAEVANAQNERTDSMKCTVVSEGRGSEAIKRITISEQASNSSPRGQSMPCVLLGRAVQVIDRGASIKISTIVGVEPESADTTASISDLEALKRYSPQLTTYNDRISPVDWGAHLRANREASSMSMLILRSPASGLIRVFTSVDALSGNSDLTPLITQTAASTPLLNCFDGDRGAIPIQAVRIDPTIAGPDGVTIVEDANACK
jgi:type II secretory pathway pseudopilin PulG